VLISLRHLYEGSGNKAITRQSHCVGSVEHRKFGSNVRDRSVPEDRDRLSPKNASSNPGMVSISGHQFSSMSRVKRSRATESSSSLRSRNDWSSTMRWPDRTEACFRISRYWMRDEERSAERRVPLSPEAKSSFRFALPLKRNPGIQVG
jgi:hypothetical protein